MVYLYLQGSMGVSPSQGWIDEYGRPAMGTTHENCPGGMELLHDPLQRPWASVGRAPGGRRWGECGPSPLQQPGPRLSTQLESQLHCSQTMWSWLRDVISVSLLGGRSGFTNTKNGLTEAGGALYPSWLWDPRRSKASGGGGTHR